MRKNGLHPGPPWRTLPGGLSAYRCPLPDHRAQKNLQAVPLALDGPFVLDPGERLHDYLRAFNKVFQGEQTLFIIDDCSASAALTKKKDMLSELAFSGRHADQSVWVLTQKYNAVLKDLREQTRWVCLFHCKDRDSFEDCLRENDVIPTRDSRRWCGSSWPRENTRSFCWKLISLLPIWCSYAWSNRRTADRRAWRAFGTAVFHCLANPPLPPVY